MRQNPARQAEVRRCNAEDHGHEFHNPQRQRGRQWPKLVPNIRDLMVLWTEWEHGIGGCRPAKSWTHVERGGGGDGKVKQMHHRRRNVWRTQQRLIDEGHNVQSTIKIIENTYGANRLITAILEAIAKDRQRHHSEGGLHPNFR